MLIDNALPQKNATRKMVALIFTSCLDVFSSKEHFEFLRFIDRPSGNRRAAFGPK